MVEDVADNAAELCGDVDAAEGHEVVDVVDDDEGRVEAVDEVLDAAVECVEVVALVAEDVETGEVEFGLADGMCLELAVELCAEVGAVDGVYPEDGGGFACSLRALFLLAFSFLAIEDLDGEVLGEVVGT